MCVCVCVCVCMCVCMHVLVQLSLAQQMFLLHTLHTCFRNKNFHINANVFRIVYIFAHLFLWEWKWILICFKYKKFYKLYHLIKAFEITLTQCCKEVIIIFIVSNLYNIRLNTQHYILMLLHPTASECVMAVKKKCWFPSHLSYVSMWPHTECHVQISEIVWRGAHKWRGASTVVYSCFHLHF